MVGGVRWGESCVCVQCSGSAVVSQPWGSVYAEGEEVTWGQRKQKVGRKGW